MPVTPFLPHSPYMCSYLGPMTQVEDLLSNTLPTLLGPWLLRSHVSVVVG